MRAEEYCRMASLDDVPFKVPMGSLDEPLGIMKPVTDLEMIIPDYHQKLHNLQYDFCLENWVLNGFRPRSNKHMFPSERVCVLPSCPPYWLLFSSPQERRSIHACRKESCDQAQRPRSLSLSSADLQRRHLHSTHHLVDNSAHEAAGYSEDDECSSTEEDRAFRSRSRERVKFSLLQESQRPASPRALTHTHKNSASSRKDMSSPPSLRLSRPHNKKHIPGGSSEKRTIIIHKPHATNSKPKPRPSSAGPQPSAHQRKSSFLQAARPRTSHGDQHSVSDSSVELLYALSQEERVLVESITAQGYTLRSAILALQRTGTRSAEEILDYLLVRDRLCALGYERTQVEDALEMFQNSESKATEFLRLLAQFCEMGFQQSTIKEVLLLHDNHRERALEELVTHVT